MQVMKFYETTHFKVLHEKWQKKLKDKGFEDHETARGFLKDEFDRRTNRFDNRERVLNFFLELDAYLNETKKLPHKHRKALELYSEGEPIGVIARKCRRHYNWVWMLIQKYKSIIRRQSCE